MLNSRGSRSGLWFRRPVDPDWGSKWISRRSARLRHAINRDL